MKVIKDLDMLHPILKGVVEKIQVGVIDKYNMPIRLFETGRDHDRHQALLTKGTTQTIVSRHLYDLTASTVLYATAVDYVYYVNRPSWNVRDNTVLSWYRVFGNVVLDTCPELIWGGTSRKSTNYNHFELREQVILDNLKTYPCVITK